MGEDRQTAVVMGAAEPMPETPAFEAAAAEHEANARVRRSLLLLSVANWVIAVLVWTISAWLGITSPASILVYTVLFVIGLFASVVAIAAYLLEKFAHRPEPAPSGAGDSDAGDAATAPNA